MSQRKFRRFDTAVSLLTLILLLASRLHAGVPGSTSPVNVDAQGLALRGYDAVAYFKDGKPIRGTENLSASYGGARYLFVSESHRKLFLEDPRKYIPQYGGFCAVGTSFGEKVDVDPETGKVLNGKLYLNNGPKTLEIFDHDTRNTISRANQLSDRHRRKNPTALESLKFPRDEGAAALDDLRSQFRSVRYTSRFPRIFGHISIQLKNRADAGKEFFNRIGRKQTAAQRCPLSTLLRHCGPSARSFCGPGCAAAGRAHSTCHSQLG